MKAALENQEANQKPEMTEAERGTRRQECGTGMGRRECRHRFGGCSGVGRTSGVHFGKWQ